MEHEEFIIGYQFETYFKEDLASGVADHHNPFNSISIGKLELGGQ